MKIMDFNCPSCGASLHVEKGKKTLSCPFCDSTVIVPDAMLEKDEAGWTQEQPTVRPTVIVDTSAVQRSCSGVIAAVVIFIIGLAAALFFWIMKSEEVKEALSGPVASLTGGSSIPLVMSFGGEGMSAGFFQDAEHVCVDPQGNIYVAEYGTGRIQVFDPYGTWTGQWEVGKAEDIYIYGMDISRDGRLYLVYDSELYIHDAQTGELLGQLMHPDGWGFEDVAVCDDGSVVASWYCNRDDILKFAPDGSLEFVLREAISGQSGDSELDTEVAVDGSGNIFAYGSFNGSIFKFSPNGRFLNRFGSDGDREGQFTSPSCMCTDPMGRIWVSDFGDLLVFDNDGTYIATLDPGETLYDLYITGDYQLFGITYEEIVVQLDLSDEVDEL